MQSPALSTSGGGALRTLRRLALPALILLVALYLAYLKQMRQKKKNQKLASKTRQEVTRSKQIVKEMEAEANFVIKVAYLKFEEQLKRKSSQMGESNCKDDHEDTQHLQAAEPRSKTADDIYLHPNFEKHTNLFLDFKRLQLEPALKRHGISIERFDSLCDLDQSLRSEFDTYLHFPFIGLVKEKGKSSFDGAAVLARPPSLSINLTQCSAQSLKAVLKKYYNSLLFKAVCQVHSKKTMYDRFQSLLGLLTDSRELSQVLDLYGLKLQHMSATTEIEDAEVAAELSPFNEVNKAYYSHVLDRAWASDILQSEQQFWELFGLMLEHGHKLKSSFWQANPLQSKRIDFCQKEIEILHSTLSGFTQMLTGQYVTACRNQIVNLVQIALQSAYQPVSSGSSTEEGASWQKLEIVRNQICVAAHHSQNALVSLKKLHDTSLQNAMVSCSHSRMQGGEAKTTLINFDGGSILKTTSAGVGVGVNSNQAIGSDGRRRSLNSGGFDGQHVGIKSPDGDLSRVDSPPDNERSNFITTTQDVDDIILNNGAFMANQAMQRESHAATSELIQPVADAIKEAQSAAAMKDNDHELTAASAGGNIAIADQASNSNRTSFKQQRQRKQRTSLTQKLALSNALKNMIDKQQPAAMDQQHSMSQLDK